jgi:hypothetical protein
VLDPFVLLLQGCCWQCGEPLEPLNTHCAYECSCGLYFPSVELVFVQCRTVETLNVVAKVV